MAKPDYDSLRDNVPYRWHVTCPYYVFYGLTDIPIEEVNLKPEAMIELIRKGRPLYREMWGEELPMPGVSTPAISYGHLNCLGAELIFPEGGEVSFKVPCDSLDEAIELLRKPVDWATAGMMPFYLDYQRQLREAFPGENVGLSFSVQGPMTTAYGLRGMEFFTDPYDDPERTKEFLDLCVDSIHQYKYFLADLNGQPHISPRSNKLYDDVGSMFSVPMWPEFVLPFYERYFGGLTTGSRGAHIEDLRPEQLHFLEDMGLSDFDPGISHKINPPIIRDRCRVPFGWRMGSFHYNGLMVDEVEEWVYQAVADGASYVFSQVAEEMVRSNSVEKLHAFTRAAKEVARLFGEGATREEIGERVSPGGKEKFWTHWPE
ncbi:MAG: uroporphyrinogen decarboxylase family protein [Candidatus Latescibacteria bacterium]|jgi:hypothetical protein|nr:uroporphyrinogen decarboxylase family protein [Candidatus Latescibacterota bacterium]